MRIQSITINLQMIKLYSVKKIFIITFRCSCNLHFHSLQFIYIHVYINQSYNKISIDQQLSKVNTIDRNELVKEKTHDKEAQNKTLLVLT